MTARELEALAALEERMDDAEWDRIEGLADQALNRMDLKGETIADAAEAVTGGGPDAAAVIRSLRGEP